MGDITFHNDGMGATDTAVASAIRSLERAFTAGNSAGSGSLPVAGSTMSPEGNVSMQASVAGVGNGADSTDDTLFTYTLPAGALDKAGRSICITAFGKFAANANSKRVKIFFGATVVADSGAQTANATGWQLQADVAKAGAAGSNTQIAQGQSIVGTTHGGVNVPLTPTENESGPIVIKVTGSSAASAANDVLGQFFQVNFMN